jgi:hypothetical protein
VTHEEMMGLHPGDVVYGAALVRMESGVYDLSMVSYTVRCVIGKTIAATLDGEDLDPDVWLAPGMVSVSPVAAVKLAAYVETNRAIAAIEAAEQARDCAEESVRRAGWMDTRLREMGA